MRSLLRKAALVVLLVGVNLVVSARESTAADYKNQICQYKRASWGCYQGCTDWPMTSCGDPWCAPNDGCP
jgi:hypothetical protein